MKLNAKIAGCVLAGVLLAAPAFAADPTGFYIGIGGGINQPDDSDVELRFGGGNFTVNNVETKLGWAAHAFAGYNFGGPRLELEVAYRNNKVKSGDLPGNNSERIHSGALMANFIYEFFSSSVVSPYIGAGAGAAMVKGTGRIDDTDVAFAYQGIAGVNVKVTPNVVLSADYRYFRTADPQLKENGLAADFDYVNHTGMVGLAYRFVKPPVAREVPVVAPAPAPTPITRSYMVFFDFDKSDITQQSLATIRLAATNAKQGGVQRLNVTGHADRAGTEQYNLALSLRRANAVKQVLIAEGIAADSIVVIGRGEKEPLVPTADGVPEAQNRRVEIILQ
jgi:OOP family OmpA-OmpF porin